MKILLDGGLLHGDCMTVTGKTIAETLADVPSQPPADQDVIRPLDNPLYAQGHLAILRGNLAEEGAVAKITGLKNPQITGPARVFNDEQSALDAILAGRSRPVTSWCCATSGRAVPRGCRRCWRRPAR
jgi:dihydroxy-acid dehydratase